MKKIITMKYFHMIYMSINAHDLCFIQKVYLHCCYELYTVSFKNNAWIISDVWESNFLFTWKSDLNGLKAFEISLLRVLNMLMTEIF